MLKKIMILIDRPEAQEQLQNLTDRLNREGLTVLRIRKEELEAALGRQEPADALFLLEHREDCERVLAAGGYPILYLHEGNAKEPFAGVRYALEGFEEVDRGFLDMVYRRYRGLPWIIGATKRCLVREITEGDLDSLKEIFRDPWVRRYLDIPEEGETREEALAGIRAYTERIYGFFGYGIWLVLDKETKEPIGCAGFSMRNGFSEPEIGFTIKKEKQRKGYAYEICRSLLDFARRELGFERVRALVRGDNAASAGLCGRLGFVKAGRVEIESGVYEQYLLELPRGM